MSRDHFTIVKLRSRFRLQVTVVSVKIGVAKDIKMEY